MPDEDLDALAAEYVLGTLAADERAHAEALIAIDPGFVEIVRQWERRLGELNVMVEAVEPPADVWDKIKSGMAPVARDEVNLAPGEPASMPPPLPRTMPPPPSAAPDLVAQAVDTPNEGDVAAADESEGETKPEGQTEAEGEADRQTEGDVDAQAAEGSKAESPAQFALQPPSRLAPPAVPESGADAVRLTGRVRRWRRLTFLTGAVAVILAGFISVMKYDPALIPPQVLTFPARNAPHVAPVAAAPRHSELVGVLQQDPNAPAFLLAVDPASRTLTVLRGSAKPQPGHSFELWLMPASAGKPLSLGLVGATEYTQRPLPSGVDADAVKEGGYVISYEPTGGSKTGAPSGPILFTGRLVEATPPAAPPPKL